jgi:hypothetical protein
VHNIFCQVNNGTPTTIVRNKEGKTQSIFHWRTDALPKATNSQQLCNDVSAKLDKYWAEVSSFTSSEIGGLPAVCAGEQGECSLVLFTLAKAEEPQEVSADVLAGILDDSLKQNKQEPVSSTRGVQSAFYPVSFWQLLGLKFIK